MKKGFERARFAVWLLLVLVLIGALFSVWRSMSRETMQTAIEVTKQRMAERANIYKQEWVLQGRPEQLRFEQDRVFMQNGWVFPKLDQGVDCEKVLFLLYPDRKVLDWLPRVTAIQRANGYQCRYQYGDRVQLDVELKDRYFAINASFLMR
ncbi:TPA: MSHA biogenesis protein MshF [Vibrio cholerae]|nr:MSHA biogenesis protein MshF [Vibrio cholerae]